jgi:hypothetical protein
MSKGSRRLIHLVTLYVMHLQAIETFVSCTKKESNMAGAAATNLSFIFYLVTIIRNYL